MLLFVTECFRVLQSVTEYYRVFLAHLLGPISGLVFIGPESDHWECLSLTPSLTHCCLVNLIDVTLACEVDNLKLVEVVTVAHVDDEKRVDNSLVQIWKVKFGHKVKFLFRL